MIDSRFVYDPSFPTFFSRYRWPLPCQGPPGPGLRHSDLDHRREVTIDRRSSEMHANDRVGNNRNRGSSIRFKRVSHNALGRPASRSAGDASLSELTRAKREIVGSNLAAAIYTAHARQPFGGRSTAKTAATENRQERVCARDWDGAGSAASVRHTTADVTDARNAPPEA